MKDYLKKLIARKKEEVKNLMKRSAESEDINEVRSIGETLTALRDEINEAEEQLKKEEEKKVTASKVNPTIRDKNRSKEVLTQQKLMAL